MRLWSVPSNGPVEVQPSVARVLAAEAAAGLDTLDGHKGFAQQVATVRNDFLEFLVACQRDGKRVAGYGAPGKGNTLLNHCGIRSDLIEFTVTATHTSTACSCLGRTFQSIRSSGWPRNDLTMSSSCRGTYGPRSLTSWNTYEVGAVASW